MRRLAERQPDRAIERRGPPLKAAFDAEGAPTQAALAFAKSCGVEVAALEHLETPKGVWLVHRGTEAGAHTASLLPGIVQASLDALPIARRMRWGAGEAQFVRPVHWVLMLFGREIVPCTILGVASGDLTYGHRFMAPKPLRVASPAAYVSTLHKRGRVLADIHERRETIRLGVTAEAVRLGGQAVISDALLDEVTALVEWPVPLAGRFDAQFLELPAGSADRHHAGPPALLPGARCRRGAHAVVHRGRQPRKHATRRRSSPATSAWCGRGSRTPRSSGPPTGSTASTRASRASTRDLPDPARLAARQGPSACARLAKSVAMAIGGDPRLADRAAELAKCDLITSMVGEFPELQGLMGRYYAQHDGEHAEVCEALREQYLPRFAGDELPATRTGMALAIADKLDTIAGIYATGQKPTGTRDPFGLRRAALGLLRTSIERRLDLDLQALIGQALAALPFAAPTDCARDVYDYVIERLRAYYVEGGAGFDVTAEMFDAVLATRPASPLDFDARLRALVEFLRLPEAQALAAANKRIANILRKATEAVGERVDADRLIDPAEQILGEQVEAIARQVEPRFRAREYTEALRSLAVLRSAVDAFFDSVMVMADDPALRANRLALLKRMQGLFMHVADLSRLPG